MIRALVDEGLLFLAPFAVFALVLLLRRRQVLHGPSWAPNVVWLAMAGLALVLASFLYAGLLERRPTTGFVPTHVENGRVVPGQFK
jgi:hypothetical protein